MVAELDGRLRALKDLAAGKLRPCFRRLRLLASPWLAKGSPTDDLRTRHFLTENIPSVPEFPRVPVPEFPPSSPEFPSPSSQKR